MDAPRGRYRVVEKNGRLIVIDNETGSPIPSSIDPSLPSARPGRSGRPAAAPASPVAPAGPGLADRAAGLLLEFVIKEWDSEGRAVIAWDSGENGDGQAWHARLDEAEQRRLGRALLALCAAPVFMIVLIFADGLTLATIALPTVPLILWGRCRWDCSTRRPTTPACGTRAIDRGGFRSSPVGPPS